MGLWVVWDCGLCGTVGRVGPGHVVWDWQGCVGLIGRVVMCETI